MISKKIKIVAIMNSIVNKKKNKHLKKKEKIEKNGNVINT
jgi:hypothetical protein